MSTLKFLGQNAVFWDRIQGVAVARVSLWGELAVRQNPAGFYNLVLRKKFTPSGTLILVRNRT